MPLLRAGALGKAARNCGIRGFKPGVEMARLEQVVLIVKSLNQKNVLQKMLLRMFNCKSILLPKSLLF